MLLKSMYEHPEWGVIKIAINNRARRIIMRAREDGIYITAPAFATQQDIERALAKHGNKLKQIQTTNSKQRIDVQRSFGDGNFRINIQEYNGKNFMWVHNENTTTLMCPQNTDYDKMQIWLRKVITNIIFEKAKKALLLRLKFLAEKHGLKYSHCSVRNSHSRWGSCSGKGNISLSIYLILLPDELIDYVLLHELCHTLEMNHSERFWSKLDNLCNCNSKEMRRRLKNYVPDI